MAKVRFGVFDTSIFTSDLCIKTNDGTYQSILPDALLNGLSPNQVSSYVEIPAGVTQFRIGRFNTNCTKDQLEVPLQTLDEGSVWTVLRSARNIDKSLPSETIVLQDRPHGNPTSVSFRAVSTVPDFPPLDMYTYEGWLNTPATPTGVIPLFQQIGSASPLATLASSQFALDSLGYIDIPKEWPATFAVEFRFSNTVDDPATVVDFAPAGSGAYSDSLTLFIGEVPQDGAIVATCLDSSVTTDGLSLCRLGTLLRGSTPAGQYVAGAIPAPSAEFRIANMSTYYPNVRVCMRPSSGTWRSGDEQALGAALPHGSERSGRAISPGEYLIAVRDSNSACDQPAATDSTFTVASGDSILAVFASETETEHTVSIVENHDPVITDSQTRIRFIGTVSREVGASALNMALGIGKPNDAASFVYLGTDFGAATTDVSGVGQPVLDSGYVEYDAPNPFVINLNMVPGVATESGTLNTVLNGRTWTIMATGLSTDPIDPNYPLRGFLCDESTAPAIAEGLFNCEQVSLNPLMP